ncbi:MAG: hypothetical protein J5969_02175 [Lachnospiraceae bacterium]|nr:hypothetical protein [Lachnospiraceae bacterium]
MENFEKVEKIVEKTGVTYEDAKAALEQSGGDLLDAIIALEKQGKIGEPRTAYYSTGDALGREAAGGSDVLTGEVVDGAGNRSTGRKERTGWENFKKECKRLLDIALKTKFVVERRGEELISIPTLALIILMFVTFWTILVLMVVGLFFGCKYHFEHPGKAAEAVNEVFEKAAETAEDIKRDFSNNDQN